MCSIFSPVSHWQLITPEIFWRWVFEWWSLNAALLHFVLIGVSFQQFSKTTNEYGCKLKSKNLCSFTQYLAFFLYLQENIVLLQDAGNDTPVCFLMFVSLYTAALYWSYHILVWCFHFFLQPSLPEGVSVFQELSFIDCQSSLIQSSLALKQFGLDQDRGLKRGWEQPPFRCTFEASVL